jgi:FkbM family methyltransferase
MRILKNGIAVIPNDTHISKWVLESGRLDHDQNMLPLLKEFIKPTDTVIDIGAYIGDHSVFYSKLASKVICFEPNPMAYVCLEHNTKNDPKIIRYRTPLSDKEEFVQMINDNQNYGMAYISHDTTSTGYLTRTLDSFDFKPNFIKIDAEGYELKILKGAKNTIEQHRPIMLIEINKPALHRSGTSFEEVFNYLRTLGYICRNIYPEQGFSDVQFDIICMP